MKFALIFLTLIFISGVYAGSSEEGRESHSLFTEILTDYVHDGKVNYTDLSKDNRLEKYLNQLSAANPDIIENTQEKLAFWINAYNAFTLKVICDNYPVKSITDLNSGKVWDEEFVEINGIKMSLNHIEHEIIRKKFDDPRIHFALVCAAVSCPPLRSEAYERYKLDSQLKDQGEVFFRQKDKNYFDLKEKKAHISKILDWYGKDFGDSNEEILIYITRFLPQEIATGIEKDPKEWEVKYSDYNWSLNE